MRGSITNGGQREVGSGFIAVGELRGNDLDRSSTRSHPPPPPSDSNRFRFAFRRSDNRRGCINPLVAFSTTPTPSPTELSIHPSCTCQPRPPLRNVNAHARHGGIGDIVSKFLPLIGTRANGGGFRVPSSTTEVAAR